MKVLQINTVCGSGSVGRITVDIVHALEAAGDEGVVAFGRKQAPGDVKTYKSARIWIWASMCSTPF